MSFEDGIASMEQMIVTLAINAAVINEREACAQECDAVAQFDLAAVIRNRKIIAAKVDGKDETTNPLPDSAR